MAHEAKDNKDHVTIRDRKTSVPGRKRPSKQRAPFGENNGTVQKEHIKDEK